MIVPDDGIHQNNNSNNNDNNNMIAPDDKVRKNIIVKNNVNIPVNGRHKIIKYYKSLSILYMQTYFLYMYIHAYMYIFICIYILFIYLFIFIKMVSFFGPQNQKLTNSCSK